MSSRMNIVGSQMSFDGGRAGSPARVCVPTARGLTRRAFQCGGYEAQDIFQDTVREAAFLVANRESPVDRYWFFREARWRCLDVVAQGVQSDHAANESTEVSPKAPEQIEQLEPEQLAIWISAAPEPQRSALALYYLEEFNYREMMSMLGLKLTDLSRAIGSGRREFQAWLNATVPVAAPK